MHSLFKMFSKISVKFWICFKLGVKYMVIESIYAWISIDFHSKLGRRYMYRFEIQCICHSFHNCLCIHHNKSSVWQWMKSYLSPAASFHQSNLMAQMVIITRHGCLCVSFASPDDTAKYLLSPRRERKSLSATLKTIRLRRINQMLAIAHFNSRL